ncbi:hypothetical protein [Pelagibacterium luteolum]|uniref:Uncharacterized protein n=1 Tax=Pelagibacterium luteolum TaxID=440168 RepID=A0A1G7VYB5_9HYPH|nr:hypothetical protein [Pelagibacterium luteolum]SDG64429.1 hypothetical protein SAMN04487974_10571 [Pelagibacterium luteolum]
MAHLSRALSPFALFLLLAASPAYAQNFDAMSVGELRSVVTDSHPSGYYVLASKLYDEGERDEAVFWFYAGQLRYRTHLACNPELTQDGDGALFSALSEVIGSEINAYAFGDIDTLIQTIDAVVAWDQSTPNSFGDDTDCGPAHDQVLAGLIDLKTYVSENADDVRIDRLATGPIRP